MSFPGANTTADHRNLFLSNDQIDAIEAKEAKERDPIRQKLGDPIKAPGRLLNFAVAGQAAVLALANYKAAVANLETKDLQKQYVKHTGPVTAVTLLSENYTIGGSRVALSASWDKTIRIWCVDRPAHVVAVLTGHTDFVKCMTVHPTLPVVYTGSADKSVMIWKLPETLFSDAASEKPVEIKQFKTIKGDHSGQIYAIALDTTGCVLYSTGSDASIRAWDASTGQAIKLDSGDNWEITRGHHKSNVFDIKVSENMLWTASADKTVIGWDIETRVPDTIIQHETFVTSVLPVMQAGVIITGTRGGDIFVWSVNTGAPELIREIRAHSDDVVCLRQQGPKFYSSSLDETLRTWDVREVVYFKGGLSYVPPELAVLERQAKKTTETTLTEDEERELAELMDDLDDL